MSDFGAYGSADRYGQDDTTGYKAAVLASGSINTKGAWTQVCASCPFDACAIMVTNQCSNGFISALIDIGVGAAASEVVLVPNVSVSQDTTYGQVQSFVAPVAIPSGTRVAMRLQASTASADFYFKIQFMSASLFGPASLQNATEYGPSLATSLGRILVAGTPADTKGSWYQLGTIVGGATTTYDISAMLFCLGLHTVPSTFMDMTFDLAVGAIASEQIIVPDVLCIALPNGAGWYIEPAFLTLPVKVPAGSSLSARCKSQVAGEHMTLSLVGFG